MSFWDRFRSAFSTTTAADKPTTPHRQTLGAIQVMPRREDFLQGTIAAGLTPQRYAGALSLADAGDLSRLARMLQGIEERSAHLAGILATRKRSVSGAPLLVTPHESDKTDAVAALVRAALANIPDRALRFYDLADGIYQPLGLAEIGWDVSSGQAWPLDLAWVDPARCRYATGRGPGALGSLRVVTDAEPVFGEELAVDKFVRLIGGGRTGYPTRQGLGRVLGWLYLFSVTGLKDWVTFAELFGMPLVRAQVASGATDEERERLKAGLASMGTEAVAVFSQDVSVEFIERSGKAGGEVYAQLLEWLDKAMSKAVLGQTLTTELGSSGSFAAARVHGEVLQSLREHDAALLAGALRRDLVEPIVRYNFGPGVPLPNVTFGVAPPADTKALAERIEILVRAGLRVPASWVYESQGIPEPQGDEPVLDQQLAKG